MDHQHWMQEALACAEQARAQGEVPIGAVIVHEQQCIARAWNTTIIDQDPTAHAEINALRQAAKHLGNHRLLGTTLYVTLAPCVMCIGALQHARVARVVYGAEGQKHCTHQTTQQLMQTPWGNHAIVWQGGVLADSCAKMLKEFFQHRR